MAEGEWRRMYDRQAGLVWRHSGGATITEEVIYQLPHDERRRLAVRMSGDDLPADEVVWPPMPKPSFNTAGEMEAAIVLLLSTPRRDLLNQLPSGGDTDGR